MWQAGIQVKTPGKLSGVFFLQTSLRSIQRREGRKECCGNLPFPDIIARNHQAGLCTGIPWQSACS
jgi:hypothetical protein